MEKPGEQEADKVKTEKKVAVVISEPANKEPKAETEVPGNQAVKVTISSAEELERDKEISISESLR